MAQGQQGRGHPGLTPYSSEGSTCLGPECGLVPKAADCSPRRGAEQPQAPPAAAECQAHSRCTVKKADTSCCRARAVLCVLQLSAG